MALSTLETICLRWLSCGQSLEEILILEAIGLNELDVALQNAMIRLEVETREDAIKKALRLNLL